ncbi:MAG: hypothetical protein FXF54_03205 [Kosmotoga sp.]|nr:MAG: hypothetical protein FXF54_03205 [Kosmotoga sp.]
MENYLPALNENQLEEEFIREVLKILGWEYLSQGSTKIQGGRRIPDHALFINNNLKVKGIKEQKESPTGAFFHSHAIEESKEWNVDLDKKGKEDTPHFQMINYLTWLKPRYGILTNGRIWRLYIKGENAGERTFYEVNLPELLENQDAFKYFYHFFAKDSFCSLTHGKTFIDRVLTQSQEFSRELEEDLKAIIYDRCIEDIGKSLYSSALENNVDYSPTIIFRTTLLLLYRLLFIAYAEAKNLLPLQEGSMYYNYSLRKVLDNLISERYASLENTFILDNHLKTLFGLINKGSEKIGIPPYDGDLFSEETNEYDSFKEAKNFLKQTIINDQAFIKILENLMLYTTNGQKHIRDYSSLDVKRLGTIYEGLMEYNFKIANEPQFLVKDKKTKEEWYIDPEDHTDDLDILRKIEEGELYLVKHNNLRKSSGSYYTPDEFVDFMVSDAINQIFEKKEKEFIKQHEEMEELQEQLDKELFDDTLRKEADQLLDIKFLDAAMGSGHFLVSALRYLTEKLISLGGRFPENGIYKKLEEIRQMLKEHSIIKSDPDDASLLKRLIAKNCLFGVDINPMATELAKLSLWLETAVPGVPLSFLSHHLRCGNSIVGYDLDDLLNELSEKAKNNMFVNAIESNINDIIKDLKSIESLEDITLNQARNSRYTFVNVARTIEPVKFLLDLKTALDYPGWKEKLENWDFFKTGNYRMLDEILLEGIEAADDELKEFIKNFREKLNPFHWKLEFPEIRKRGGFDIAIGNPPWDKVKPEDEIFFSQFDPKYRRLNNRQKKALQNRLLAKKEVKTKWERNKKEITNFAYYLKNNYHYYADKGDINLFRIFTEKNLEKLKQDGILNYLVLGGIYQEEGSDSLRKALINEYHLRYILGFENRDGKGKKFFPDVDSRMKFAVISATNNQIKTEKVKTFFLYNDKSSLNNLTKNVLDYPVELLEKLSPKHKSFLELKSQLDIEIVKKAYSLFPKLSDNGKWNIDFQRDLDMTNDKNLFHENGDIPLYEGKMIHQFRHDLQEPRYYLKLDELKNINRLKVSSNEEKETWRWDFYRITYREVASNTNARTVISTILPKKLLCGHKLFVETISVGKKNIKSSLSPVQKFFSIGVFNSFVFDYLARFLVSTTVSKTYFMRLPSPRLKIGDPYIDEIVERSTRLICYAPEFDELAESVGLNWQKDGIPPSEEDKRIKLRGEIDAMVAKIYQLNKTQFEHVLNSVKAGKDSDTPLKRYMDKIKAEALKVYGKL